MPTADFNLPALRHLGDLADHEPVIVVDTREIQALSFSRLQSVRKMLTTGDYSVRGLEQLFAVERKSITDLASCCLGQNRERFSRELHRLRGFRFKRLLIVGSEEDIYRCRYHSSISPKAVLATLAAFEVRYDCAVVFRSSPEVAARQIESWAFWFAREMVEVVNDLWRARESV